MDDITIWIITIILGSIGTYVVDRIIAKISNIGLFKRICLFLKDKKFKIKISGRKTYNSFNPDMQKIKKELLIKFDTVRVYDYGKNYLTILLNDMQAPYHIEITPDISVDDFLDEEGDELISNEISVLIELAGNVDFRYRDSKNNKDYLKTLDKIFKIIGKIYNETPTYENFSLMATTREQFDSTQFEKNQSKKYCDDTSVISGMKILEIKSDSVDNIYSCLNKNLSVIL